MTDKKNGNAFTNNPLVRAIGVQKIVVVIVLIALIAFFSAVSPSFRQYSTLLSIMDYTYYLAFLGIGVTFCLITGGVDLSIGTRYVLLRTDWRIPDYTSGNAGYRRYSGNPDLRSGNGNYQRTDCFQGADTLRSWQPSVP